MARLIALWVMLLGMVVWGKTYYVDTNNPQANDANAGTAALPWKTIQKAANTMVAGDTVIVNSGTYNERVAFAQAGTQGNKIVIKAEPRRSVYMQGFNTSGADYLRIEGFDITYDQGGWLNGGIWLSSDNVEIVDNYLHDIPGPAVQASWSGMWDSVYVAGNRIYGCNEGIVAGGYDWLVENNDVERLRFPEAGDCDYSRFFGERLTFRNNHFHGTLAAEIGQSHTDGFQTFDDNGEFARDILIENNYVESFHQGMMIGMGETGNAVNITVRNNIFCGGEIGGAWGICTHNVENLVAVNNVICNMVYHGIGLRGYQNQGRSSGIVKNNIFYNAGSNYWTDDLSTVEGGYNIIYSPTQTLTAGDYDPKDLVNVNPRFVSTALAQRDDFKLQALSPAIDAGVSLAGVVDADIIGTSRPQGTGWDMGAFEYITTDIRRPVSQDRMSDPYQETFYPNPIRAAPMACYLRMRKDLKIYDFAGQIVDTRTTHCHGVYFQQESGDQTLHKITIIK